MIAISVHQTNLKQANAAQKKAEDEVGRLGQELSDKDARIGDLSKEIGKLRTENEDLQKDNAKGRDEADAISAQKTQDQNEMKKMETKIEELKAEVKKLQESKLKSVVSCCPLGVPTRTVRRRTDLKYVPPTGCRSSCRPEEG